MYQSLKKRLKIEIEEIKDSGRYKNERIITSPQKAIINANEDEVVNFCANNYLGLASRQLKLKTLFKLLRISIQSISLQ